MVSSISAPVISVSPTPVIAGPSPEVDIVLVFIVIPFPVVIIGTMPGVVGIRRITIVIVVFRFIVVINPAVITGASPDDCAAVCVRGAS